MCPQMKYLLACGNSILTLPNVETIKVSFCYKLYEQFQYVAEGTSGVHPIVPNLRTLALKYLPELQALCRPEESWPSLEFVDVAACNLLRRLPLTRQNANTTKEIRGESVRWRRLVLDNESTKQILQQYFVPISILCETDLEEHFPSGLFSVHHEIFQDCFTRGNNIPTRAPELCSEHYCRLCMAIRKKFAASRIEELYL